MLADALLQPLAPAAIVAPRVAFAGLDIAQIRAAFQGSTAISTVQQTRQQKLRFVLGAQRLLGAIGAILL